MSQPVSRPIFLILTGGAIILAIAGFFAYRALKGGGVFSSERDRRVIEWIRNSRAHPDWAIEAKQRCLQAPFQTPTSGLIGYLWDDSFQPGHRHQGIDLFGGGQPGETPVYAAYSGYLTRLADWKSTVIIRIPSDPLQPNRQIWTYYTHMATNDGESLIDMAFPPGTVEKSVNAGTLLGYQGNYSGDAGSPVGVHLHFSIVKDNGQGKFLNELEINNTLDPSPYLGLTLNAHTANDGVVICGQD